MLNNDIKTTRSCAGSAATGKAGASPAVYSPCAGGDAVGLERTRYFPRQLVTPDDLTQDQVYFRDKLRRHNRMLHGWGVVCGARIQWREGDCSLIVESGYILGPYGDEIVIPKDQLIDICKQDLNGNTFSACGDVTDPWCKDVRASRKTNHTYYLAVRYDECQTRPVSVPSGECGCAGGQCEYTRIHDSFVFQILDELPDSYLNMEAPSINTTISCNRQNPGRSCLPCSDDPWVILADLTLAADGSLTLVDCFAHRRFVATFAEYFYTCGQMRLIEPGYSNYGMRPMNLVDVKGAAAGKQPDQAVAVRAPGGAWTTLPIYFKVQPGETLASLLAREGSRSFYDSSVDQTYTLSELYALSGAKPEMVLNSQQDALTPLEGASLNVGDLRVVNDSLKGLLDPAGLNTYTSAHLADPAAAPTLSATTLAGAAPDSAVGKAAIGKSISDIAAAPQADFVNAAVAAAPKDQAAAVAAQARDVWTNASRVLKLAKAWKPG